MDDSSFRFGAAKAAAQREDREVRNNLYKTAYEAKLDAEPQYYFVDDLARLGYPINRGAPVSGEGLVGAPAVDNTAELGHRGANPFSAARAPNARGLSTAALMGGITFHDPLLQSQSAFAEQFGRH